MRIALALTLALFFSCGPTVGDACTVAAQCGGLGQCLNADFAPGGYCTVSCGDSRTSCPGGTTCINDVLGRGKPGCMRTCVVQGECREGYVCQSQRDSALRVCVGPKGV